MKKVLVLAMAGLAISVASQMVWGQAAGSQEEHTIKDKVTGEEKKTRDFSFTQNRYGQSLQVLSGKLAANGELTMASIKYEEKTDADGHKYLKKTTSMGGTNSTEKYSLTKNGDTGKLEMKPVYKKVQEVAGGKTYNKWTYKQSGFKRETFGVSELDVDIQSAVQKAEREGVDMTPFTGGERAITSVEKRDNGTAVTVVVHYGKIKNGVVEEGSEDYTITITPETVKGTGKTVEIGTPTSEVVISGGTTIRRTRIIRR